MRCKELFRDGFRCPNCLRDGDNPSMSYCMTEWHEAFLADAWENGGIQRAVQYCQESYQRDRSSSEEAMNDIIMQALLSLPQFTEVRRLLVLL